MVTSKNCKGAGVHALSSQANRRNGNVPPGLFSTTSSSSPAFRPNRPLTTRTPSRSSSSMTQSLLGFGRMVLRHARVKALARAHFSSASAEGNVPKAIVFPAHYIFEFRRPNEAAVRSAQEKTCVRNEVCQTEDDGQNNSYPMRVGRDLISKPQRSWRSAG